MCRCKDYTLCTSAEGNEAEMTKNEMNICQQRRDDICISIYVFYCRYKTTCTNDGFSELQRSYDADH